MTTAHQLRRQLAADRGEVVPPGSVPAAAVLGVGVACIVGLAVAMERTSYDIWAAFWIAPVLLVLCLPLVAAVARAEQDPGLTRFLLGAAFLKIVVGSASRYATLEVAYSGGGDSNRYDAAGELLAPTLRSGIYQDLGKISGTRFVEVLTGQVYAFTGATELGGFLVFSFLAFVGMLGFYRAFVLAFPQGDRRRYRLLLFLFPTMWFWPSSIGKDAWMVCCLGIAAYGLASAFHGRFSGLAAAGLGLWGATVVRPHLTLIFVVAAAALVLVRLFPSSGPRSDASAIRRTLAAAAVVGAIALGSVFAVGQLEERFDLDQLDAVSAETVFEETSRRTGQGGSQFDAPSPGNPVGYVNAAVTVLLRPLPFEATNVQALVSSLEGMALLVLAGASLHRLVRLPWAMLREPWLAFATVYVFTFVYAFASVENFGILSRQRVQVLPLVLIVLAMPRRQVESESA